MTVATATAKPEVCAETTQVFLAFVGQALLPARQARPGGTVVMSRKSSGSR